MKILKEKCSDFCLKKLEKINNLYLFEFIENFVSILNPKTVFICSDTTDDIEYIKNKSLINKEETSLKIKGHTVHFDSIYDQGRDKNNTRILIEKNEELGYGILTGERNIYLPEIREILSDIMKGKELFICFYTLGPNNSVFSIPCIQITDSAYVAHSEFLLYRPGYEEFIKRPQYKDFFKFIHSEGELTENKVVKNISKRRVYIDIHDNTVYSANSQYAGNTIGLKKLAMRLAINKASRENWLCEHMLIMGIKGKCDRLTYFAGAFPSMCGKTSTAMMDGEKIVGDDIAYLRIINGKIHAANVERGMFGIIKGINRIDDPIQFEALSRPNEIIFSNILVTDDDAVYWDGKDNNVPEKGHNHSGEWYKGKLNKEGKLIPVSHPNARFTISLNCFTNIDSDFENPNGVELGAIVYGARDSDTSPPVEEAFNWEHGIITKGASIESETTAATLGKVGVREFNPMSNLDFLSIPLGKYIHNYLEFPEEISGKTPKIFSVNYFLKDKNGSFLNEKTDKIAWFKWMEKRVHNECGFIEIPTGKIPLYQDIKEIFKEILDKDYSYEQFNEEFLLRIPENLSKIERILKIYHSIKNIPKELFIILNSQKERLIDAGNRYGDYVIPEKFIK